MSNINEGGDSINKVSKIDVENDAIHAKNHKESGLNESVRPEGEIFIGGADIESGSYLQEDALIDLGCSCKNELALVHYACALKWFISHGSTKCEICGSVAKSVRPADYNKVIASLKECEALKERTATGELTWVHMETRSGVDPDGLAAVQRQRLSEVSSWFNPRNSTITVSHEAVEQLPNFDAEIVVTMENRTTKWAVEGTGILVATGLLTVMLTWLIGPRFGKVIFSRIKYGPARYWAVLFVFWFLVFGILGFPDPWSSVSRFRRELPMLSSSSVHLCLNSFIVFNKSDCHVRSSALFFSLENGCC